MKGIQDSPSDPCDNGIERRSLPAFADDQGETSVDNLSDGWESYRNGSGRERNQPVAYAQNEEPVEKSIHADDHHGYSPLQYAAHQV